MHWTPSIVPNGYDQTVLEILADLLTGQYNNPIRGGRFPSRPACMTSPIGTRDGPRYAAAAAHAHGVTHAVPAQEARVDRLQGGARNLARVSCRGLHDYRRTMASVARRPDRIHPAAPDSGLIKMNWGWLARHTTTAIGLTFVIVAAVYIAVRLLVLVM
jgi:hypothetical protein